MNPVILPMHEVCRRNKQAFVFSGKYCDQVKAPDNSKAFRAVLNKFDVCSATRR